MSLCPSFVAELNAQMDLALREQDEASERGDATGAEVAAGRVADLREILERFEEPLAAGV